MTHLTNVIRGSDNQYVKSYGHDNLAIYGYGSEQTEEFWKLVLRQTLLLEFLKKDIDQVGVLKVAKKGHAFLKDPYTVELTRDHDYSALGEGEEEIEKDVLIGKAYDETLFEMLKSLRKQIAKERGLPPYVIFQVHHFINLLDNENFIS